MNQKYYTSQITLKIFEKEIICPHNISISQVFYIEITIVKNQNLFFPYSPKNFQNRKMLTYHYKKRIKLDHLNWITKLNDFVLNHLFTNETNINNLTSITINDVILIYLASVKQSDIISYHFNLNDIIIYISIN